MALGTAAGPFVSFQQSAYGYTPSNISLSCLTLIPVITLKLGDCQNGEVTYPRVPCLKHEEVR
jgi:hypothetical protein